VSDFPDGILNDVAHRPWPMPSGPWIMTQSWHDLLFAHWRVDARILRERVPAALPLDLFNGEAWLGIVPFRMTNVAPRGVPAVPFVSAFPELNVRTYVSVEGKPGVYFFSLDAGNALAVAAARTLFGLPYYSADMQVAEVGGRVHYRSDRTGGVAAFEASYRPVGAPQPPLRGTLEHFLTERYCLYTATPDGRVTRVEIHHPAWPLQAAEAEIHVNTMADAAGLALPPTPPLLHFARRQDMVAWPMERVALT
jgi:uncharacterized protein YqjF (DUF2071 family)